MAERMLEQVFAIWTQEPRQVASGHLAESMLLDLIQQQLSPQATTQALQHLAACSVCGQALKGLLRYAGAAPRILTQELRRAAADFQSGDQALPMEDTTGQVEFIEERDADGRFLTLRVRSAYKPAFEGRYVIVWDGHKQLLHTGQITAGTLSFELERDRALAYPLSCTVLPGTA